MENLENIKMIKNRIIIPDSQSPFPPHPIAVIHILAYHFRKLFSVSAHSRDHSLHVILNSDF
jgi:hypothetical protein